jgi:hypothetical protein
MVPANFSVGREQGARREQTDCQRGFQDRPEPAEGEVHGSSLRPPIRVLPSGSWRLNDRLRVARYAHPCSSLNCVGEGCQTQGLQNCGSYRVSLKVAALRRRQRR